MATTQTNATRLRLASPCSRLRVERMVEANAKLVHWSVRTVLRLHPNDADYDDAAQLGLMALANAAEKWSYTRGVKFASYAAWAVRNSLLAFWRSSSRHGFTCLSHDQQIDRPLSFDGVDREDGVNFLAVVGEAGDEAAEENEANRLLDAAMAKLGPRHRRVVEGRWRGGMTLDELGRELGVTKERVRQMDVQARRDMAPSLARAGLGELPPNRCRSCGREIGEGGRHRSCKPGRGCKS